MQPSTSRRAGAALLHSLANAITLAALSFGLFAMFFASAGNIAKAIVCVMLAALLDACDGRVARATGSQSKFGAELDSLSDVICFGAAPAFILGQWMDGAFGPIGYLPSVALASACALRLARFNVSSSEPGKPAWMDGYFTGVPAPAGAFVSLLPVYIDFAATDATLAAQKLALLSVPLTAFLMVSRIPTFSGKHLSRKLLRRWFLPTFAAAIVSIFGLLNAPWLTFAIGVAAYVATFPMSHSRFKVLSARQA